LVNPVGLIIVALAAPEIRHALIAELQRGGKD